MSTTDTRKEPGPTQQLTLLDCTCIIVGIIVGAGIFESSPRIAASTGSPSYLFGAWLLGGLIALVGALCYAELTTTYPRQGGDYVFLSKAYGRWLGFLFVWVEFWIIRPCSIGAMAFVFARFADQLVPLGSSRLGLLVYACGAVLVLTGMNALGVKTGKWTQNVLTLVKVLGLFMIVAVARLLIPDASVVELRPTGPPPDFRLAMIMVLFTYGGWNDISYVAAELRSPHKNVLRSLVLGTLLVTLVYVLVNVAFLRGLGFRGLAESEAVAADLLDLALGKWGGWLISFLICVSCLGAISAMIFTGARIYYALGLDHATYAWLGKWNPRFGLPMRALLLQSAIVLALMISFGAYGDGFERLVVFSTPFFWLFLSLVAISLFVLRRIDPHTPRPYRVGLYPLTPILLLLAAAFMFYSGVEYAVSRGFYTESLWAMAVTLAGVLACVLGRNRWTSQQSGQ